MITFYAIVHKDADSAFGVAFPDLPGCYSAADDEGDIYVNAQEALALYLEDETEVPVPRTVEKLWQDPGLRADLLAGAFLIAVPLIFSARKERFNLMLDRAQVESVDAIARTIGVSRSEFVGRAIDMRLTAEIGAAVLDRRPPRATTSGKVASAAAKVMKDPKASKEAKSAAASALTQKGSDEKTSAAVATKASKVLRDKSASAAEKTVAASALTQKTKAKAAPAAAAPAAKAPAAKKAPAKKK